jgi:wyosine [tRNA(Phe)-imidazoG37] synthetase (radical SAM superfamily)
LATFAPDLMTAAKEGEPAMRRKLREIEHQLRRKAGEALTLIVAEGKTDEDAGGADFDFGDGE